MFNPEEVAAAARKAARMLGESGAVGRVETDKGVITFDGNLDGKTIFPGDSFGMDASDSYVYVSDKALEASEIKKIFVSLIGEEGSVDYTENILIGQMTEITVGLEGKDGLFYGVCLMADMDTGDGNVLTKGVYLLHSPINGIYVSAVHYDKGETIHTIDPKFIPGAVLPVVEITTANYPPDTSTTVTLSAEDAAKLDAAAETGLPAAIKFGMDFNGEKIVFAIVCDRVDLAGYASFVATNVIFDNMIIWFNQVPDIGWTMGGN